MSQPRNGARRVRFDGRRVSAAVSRWLRAAVSLAAAAGAVGCESHPTASDGAFRVEFSVSSTELLLPGDSLVMRVTVRTDSRWPRELPPRECRDAFEVRNEAGALVRQVTRSCVPMGRPIGRPSPRLASRARPFTYEQVWRGDLGFEPVTGVAIQPEPGRYFLMATVADGLVSEPIPIRVRLRTVGGSATR